jgi:hypothetical protein
MEPNNCLWRQSAAQLVLDLLRGVCEHMRRQL